MNPGPPILVVDDTTAARKATVRLLERAGYPVIEAADGETALRMIRESHPRLVLLDIALPDISGLDVLTQVRAGPAGQSVGIVILSSAHTSSAAQASGLERGADGYIARPISTGELLARVRLYLRQQELTEQLRESETRFRSTFEQAAAGMAHVAPTGHFLRVNDKLCQIVGYTREELLGLTFAELTVAEDRAEGLEARRALLAGERTSYAAEKRYRRKDGSQVWASLVTTLERTPDGQPRYFISVFTDITARKLAEFRLHRLNRLHTVLSKTGEAIVRTRDRAALYAAACRIVVEHGGLPTACIAEPDFATRQVHIVTSWGTGRDYLETMTVTTDDGPAGQGPIGTALRTGVHDVCNDFAHDARMGVWRESAHRHGIHATASFPLHPGGVTTGALVLFAAETGYFQDDEIRLMAAVAESLSFALEAFEQERQRREAETALRASEERFASAFEYSAIGMALVSPAGRHLKVNRSFCQMLGYAAPELLDRTFHDITFPEDLAADLVQVGQLLDGTIATYQMEKRYFHRDGHLVWVLLSVSLIRDPAGQPLHFVSQIQDITERKAAEVHLRQSEERFRLLAKASHAAVWDWDMVSGAHVWNEGVVTLFGYAREEITPTIDFCLERIHPDDGKAVGEIVHHAIDSGAESWAAEYRFRRKDGGYTPVRDCGYIIRDASGQPVRMIGGMTDLTQSQAAADRIAEQAALLDAASDAIILKDLSGRILFWNRGAEKIYGWTTVEMAGKSSREELFAEPARFDEAVGHLLQHDHWHGEAEFRTRDDRRVATEIRWTLVRDGGGQPRSILAINTDITERKQTEQKFLRAQRMESIGTLAGGIAHDLNNILAPILMSVGLLQREVTSDLGREMLATLQSCSQRGADLVRQVLSFARGVEGQRISVNPVHLVRDIQKIVRETFPKNITFRGRLPTDLWTVTGDPTQLHQVLMNLAVNARDAMPDGGTLTVALENVVLDAVYAGMNPDVSPGSYVQMQVTDTGTGVAPNIRDRIFEPFFTTKETGKGTGLGLSTSLAIIRSHGGAIQVSSEPGKGTKFTIHLPADTTATTPAETTVDPAELPRGRGELILIVDDEESIRRIARNTLEHFGYRVLLAANGAEAIGLYAQQRDQVAVVLTDMAMPVMDGAATIKALRALDPQVRIIGSSGVAHATDAGLTHFVPKPYTAEKLLRTLAQVLHGPE